MLQHSQGIFSDRPIRFFDDILCADYWRLFNETNRPPNAFFTVKNKILKIHVKERPNCAYMRQRTLVIWLNIIWPQCGDLSYARMLIKHKIERTHEELRAVDGRLHDTTVQHAPNLDCY